MSTNRRGQLHSRCVAPLSVGVGWKGARLPDGYSQIFGSYMFDPSGIWTMAPLHYTTLRPHALHPGAIQGKEGVKFCYLATVEGSGWVK